MLELNKIYNQDCLEGMKLIEDNSVDSIVTDPPYELGFMGKKWDNTGISYNVEVWKEALRILKPGGHLLAFGGTRTYHRMAVAIEDAGFEIRDQMQWIYGSGFPKSYNISKGMEGYLTQGSSNTKDYKNLNKKNIKSQGLGFNNIHLEQGDRPESYELGGTFDLDATTQEAKQWSGWGTALKPANEPIVVARKPLSEKTVVENVLKWGTGGINIDGCRIETTDNLNGGAYSGGERSEGEWKEQSGFKNDKLDQYQQPAGRFPANIIFDEEAGRLLDEQSGMTKSGKVKNNKESYAGESNTGFIRGFTNQENQHGDSGGASRFFYCAKASKSDRGEGNTHPTVKPIKLMEYLIKLVTPPSGTCLDPFMGSGTTAVSAVNNNINYIGFEMDEQYHKIATERVENHKIKLALRADF